MSKTAGMRLLQDAKRFPMLTPERERDLAIAWRERHDRGALRELVGSHLRLVFVIARSFSGYGLPQADLVASGNLGLVQAATKFEPDRGSRFATYAMWWIRAAMQEFVMHSWSLVKIGTTAAQKKLFFNLRRLKSKLGPFETKELSLDKIEFIADTLGVSEAEVVRMNCRLSGRDDSLDCALSSHSDALWVDTLCDESPDQETVVADREIARRNVRLLDAAIRTLGARERTVVIERYLSEEQPTLQELSERFAVSAERVRQIELSAFAKLRRFIDREGCEQ